MENLRGIALMLVAMLGFAIADAIIKFMSDYLPVAQIIFVMGIGGCLIFGATAIYQGGAIWSRNFWSMPVVIRNIAEVVGSLCFVTSLTLIPISTASAILQASPLLITLGAAVFLKEPIGWRRWIAIVIGFAGVLLIIRPGMDSFDPASLFAIVGVIGLSIRDLATRKVPSDISAPVLATYGFAMLIPTSAILFAAGPAAVALTGNSVALLMVTMVCVAVAYLSIISAMRTGEVGAVTPFRYSRLIFAILIGVIFFGERPELWTLIGAALVVGSGLYTFIREQQISRNQTALSTQTQAQ